MLMVYLLKTSIALNFITLRCMAKAFVKYGMKERTTVELLNLVRTPQRTIETRPMTKTFNFTYEKRRILPDFTTLPFGY